MAALLIFGQSYLAQSPLGIGLVDVNFDDKTVIHFYKTPRVTSPSRTIKFFDDKSINSWNIVDLQSARTWLAPESLWLDYHSFVFRCIAKRAGWLQVIVNNRTGESFWIRSSQKIRFSTWDSFLKRMFSITRNDRFPQKLRAEPSDTAQEIRFRGRDCFDVIAMRGDWVRVKQAGHCESPDKRFRSGWIRWRRGRTLHIEYFITS